MIRNPELNRGIERAGGYGIDQAIHQQPTWIVGVEILITSVDQDPHACKSKSYERSEHDNKKSWRPGLALGYGRLIQHFYRGDFFRLLDLGQFVLLGQNFKDSLIDLGPRARS